MALMTRSRADINGINSDLSALYYAQRACVGLLITEGINISLQALGSPFTPGIYARAQIDAFEKKGNKITVSANDDSHFILFGGTPLNEPIVGYASYVMNTQ
ncbi:MAG: hypothetical protein H7Y86_07125 [Rhizobacter sp.]|nr:hypothetical protein [Ferruginibacter sp.]